jgi:septum formation topological specificity factor MinE
MMTNARVPGAALTVGLVAVLLTVAGLAVAQQSNQRQQLGEAPSEGEPLQIGTYQPQQVFRTYHGREAFMNQLQRWQEQMQSAQEAGDRQQIVDVRRQMEQRQQEVVQQFREDISQVMPEVAEQAGVDLVVVQVDFKQPAMRTQDVTDQVSAALSELAEEEEASEDESVRRDDPASTEETGAEAESASGMPGGGLGDELPGGSSR